jgi:hypothetical protein
MYNNQFGPRRPYPKSGIPKHYAWAPADSQHNFLHVCNHCSGLVLRDSTQDIAQRAAPYLQLVAQRLPMVCSEWITRHCTKHALDDAARASRSGCSGTSTMATGLRLAW